MKKILFFLTVLLLFAACTGAKRGMQKKINVLVSQNSYENQFTGLFVLDPQTGDTLIHHNAKKYFTPASNTKIITLFTALNMLPDSIPALNFMMQNDTLYIEGTGDPTFLHSYFESDATFDFLAKHENIALYLNNFRDEKLGPGWAWDDYHYAYQPEKSAFPLYGNVLTISNSRNLAVTPSYFKDSVLLMDFITARSENSNTFYFSPERKDTLEIPIKINTSLTRILLEDALKKNITTTKKMPLGEKNTFYSLEKDTVLRRMMHESDNFLAEQLLVMASSTLSDTLDGRKAQQYILENQLSDLARPPRWVDGSGLSRYNLFTPESIVQVLHLLYKDISRERLLSFFPAGGAKGSTLEDWYKGDPDPYIYAKTGSLGNNHNLSGYLITKSGKTLIFSFMNNHFMEPSSEVKQRMQLVLESIRDNY